MADKPSNSWVSQDYRLPLSEGVRAKEWRTVADFPFWQRHRSPYRLINSLFKIPQSQILINTLPSVAWTTGTAIFVTLYMQELDAGVLPSWAPSLEPNQACQSFINSTAVALSLLLVFRTNTSYARWDEARKMWGLMLNRSRDLARQSCSILSPEDDELKASIARWTIAFSRVTRLHLQPDQDISLDEQLGGILSPNEMEILRSSGHRPCTAIAVLSQLIQNAEISSIHQAQMSTNLTTFHDILGGCERILRAPIPVSYTRHTARFLFSWLTCLPFAIYGTTGPWCIPVVAAISLVLCGIEEIGVQVEEPFGILPLEVICGRIQTDVMGTLDAHHKVQQEMFKTEKRMETVSMLN